MYKYCLLQFIIALLEFILLWVLAIEIMGDYEIYK